MAPTRTHTVPGSRPLTAAPALSTYARGIVVAALLGLAARGLFLNHLPLWSDEAFMGVLARKSIPAMFDVIHNDNHPPLMYLLDWAARAVHDSPAWLRLPSSLAGVAAVPVAGALGRRLGGDRGGVAAALVVATEPLLVLWSRDARMYGLGTTLALLTALTLWRVIERPSGGRAITHLVACSAALYTQYLLLLALPLELLAALVFLRPSRRALAFAAGSVAGALLLLVPWLVYAAPQFRHAGQPYWVKNPVLGIDLAHFDGRQVFTVGAVAAIALLVPLGVRAYRAAAPATRAGMGYLVACAGLPYGALLAVSLRQPLLDERFISMLTPALLPVAGAALAALERWWLVAGITLLLGAVTAVQVASVPTPDVAAAIAPLAGRVTPTRDVVALNGPNRYYPVLYYGDAATAAAVRVVTGDRAIPWYDGLAGYPEGVIVHDVPRATGSVYLVTDPGQPRPPMPAGMHLAGRTCVSGSCLETWVH